MTQDVPDGRTTAVSWKMSDSAEISADHEDLSSRADRCFDTGCTLFFDATLEQPLLALDLLLAMQLWLEAT